MDEALNLVPDALIVAQTARATAEAERAHYHDLWVAACAERDIHLATGRQVAACLEKLGALEAAARAWAHYRTIARDPKTLPEVWWENTGRLVAAESALDAAVAALDGVAREAPVQAAGER